MYFCGPGFVTWQCWLARHSISEWSYHTIKQWSWYVAIEKYVFGYASTTIYLLTGELWNLKSEKTHSPGWGPCELGSPSNKNLETRAPVRLQPHGILGDWEGRHPTSRCDIVWREFYYHIADAPVRRDTDTRPAGAYRVITRRPIHKTRRNPASSGACFGQQVPSEHVRSVSSHQQVPRIRLSCQQSSKNYGTTCILVYSAAGWCIRCNFWGLSDTGADMIDYRANILSAFVFSANNHANKLAALGFAYLVMCHNSTHGLHPWNPRCGARALTSIDIFEGFNPATYFMYLVLLRSHVRVTPYCRLQWRVFCNDWNLAATREGNYHHICFTSDAQTSGYEVTILWTSLSNLYYLSLLENSFVELLNSVVGALRQSSTSTGCRSEAACGLLTGPRLLDPFTWYEPFQLQVFEHALSCNLDFVPESTYCRRCQGLNTERSISAEIKTMFSDAYVCGFHAHVVWLKFQILLDDVTERHFAGYPGNFMQQVVLSGKPWSIIWLLTYARLSCCFTQSDVHTTTSCTEMT